MQPRRSDDLAVQLVWGRRRPTRAHRDQIGAVAELLLPAARIHSGPRQVEGPDFEILASYLPFPTRSGARILLPLATPAAAAAALTLRTLTGRRDTHRLSYGPARAALRVGLAQQIFRSRVLLKVRREAGGDLSEVSLPHRVSQLVGEPVHLAGRGGPPDPHRTVTMHAIAADGRLVAFVKITRSALSCEQLENEAAALRQLPPGGTLTVDVPELIHNEHWNGLGLLVVSPMNLVGGDQPTLEEPPSAAAMLEVAASGVRSRGRLDESVYWSRTAQRIEGLRGSLPASDRTWLIASDLYRGLTGVAGRAVLDFGAWHGDWLPWNMGWRGGRLLTWDWEYWSDSVPVGFDMLHFYGGTVFFRDRADAGEAMKVARARGGAVLEAAGFSPSTVDTIHALYVLEFLLRRLDIAAHGGGVDDDRVFPSLAPVAFEALAQASAARARGASGT